MRISVLNACMLTFGVCNLDLGMQEACLPYARARVCVISTADVKAGFFQNKADVKADVTK
jgi:hypothetical protein